MPVVAMARRALVLFALWLWLDDTVVEPELITGAVVALGAAAIATMLAPRPPRQRFRLAMLRHAWRPPLLLVTDTVRVTRALLTALAGGRAPHGRLRAVGYRATGDSPEELTRRILTEWGASLAPDRYVIGIDREAGLLLVHELVPAAGPLDPLELG